MCFPTDFPIPSVQVSKKRTMSAKTSTASKAAPIKKAHHVKKQRRSVRFPEHSVVTAIAVRPALTTEEVQSTWNQPQDIQNIKEGIREAIRAVVCVQGNLSQIDASVHCFRGIETGICPTIGKMKKFWAKTTTQNVLDEQRMQRAAGVFDMQRLGDISRMASEESIRAATAMASLDAKCC